MKRIIPFLLIIFTTFCSFIFIAYGGTTTANSGLIVENVIVEGSLQPIVLDNEILIPLSIIKDYIDETAYYEESNKKIIFTTTEKVITMNTDKLTALVNSKPVSLNIPAQIIESEPYIPIQFLSNFLNIEVSHIKETDRVVIDFKKPEYSIGLTVKDNLSIRESEKLFAKKTEKNIKKNTELRVYEVGKKYTQVRTPNGNLGYIENKSIQTSLKKTGHVTPQIKTPWKVPKGKLNLTWEYIYKTTPEVATLKTVNGLDVISPTWFYIGDKDGTIVNKADKRYSDWAHKNGYQVWGLLSNDFDADLTKVILRDSNLRDKVIKQILIYSELYDMDGINIDFESIYSADKDYLTQFIRELAPLCKEQGLVLSMDVPTPSDYEKYGKSFDYAALSKSVDYIMLMAYDQHWGSSPVAGSVAQYTWVESGIKKTLAAGVDKEKLVLGAPTYTRLWKETVENGKTKVSSKSLSMAESEAIVAEKGLIKTWDEPSGQYYVTYTEEGITYKIWIEDEKSIDMKSSLVHKYQLAGLATWRRGFENEGTWDILKRNLKEIPSYEAWKALN